MAEVTKKIEDVDKLFKEIVINGEVHTSSRYTPHRDYVPRKTTQVTQEAEHTSVQPEVVSTTQGEDVHAVNLNDILHNFSDASLTVALQTEVETREQADTALAGAISAEATARQNAITAEATAREQADTALSNDISAETTARQNADTTLQGNITAEATARQNADTTLQGNITAEATARQNADTALSGDITANTNDISAINSKIPNQASAQNQLADKAFVNSSVATNTANYISNNGLPFNSLAELEAYSGTVTNNDYAFVTGTDSAGNTYYDRYKATVVGSIVTWALEYRLNNSSFTAEQWATINSGLTQSSVASAIEEAIKLLDVASVGGTGKYIESISEVDGKIVPVEKSLSTAVTSGDSKPVTSDAVYQAIQGAGITAVDVVQSGNMNAVTSNAVANYKPANATHADSADSASAVGGISPNDLITTVNIGSYINGKANGNLSVYHLYLTPRQFNTELSSILANYPVGSFISIAVGWEEYQSFAYAGTHGFIIITGGSAYAFGILRSYSYSGEQYGFHWIDSLGQFSGIYELNIPRATNATNAGNADTVDSYHADVDAHGNTVVARNASGYIFGVVFNAGVYPENINSYSNPKLLFQSTDGYYRSTDPSNVHVGRANVSESVVGGMTGVGSGTVYSVDGNNFYNAYHKQVMVVSRFNAGFGVYYTSATIIQPNSYGAVVNFNDGKDFWFGLA